MNVYYQHTIELIEQQKLINNIKFIYSYQKHVNSYIKTIKELKKNNDFYATYQFLRSYKPYKILPRYNKYSEILNILTNINAYKYYKHYIYHKDIVHFSIEIKNIIAENLKQEYGREITGQDIINFEHKINNLSENEFFKQIEDAKASFKEKEINHIKAEAAINQKELLIERLQQLSIINFKTVSEVIKSWLTKLKFSKYLIRKLIKYLEKFFKCVVKVVGRAIEIELIVNWVLQFINNTLLLNIHVPSTILGLCCLFGSSLVQTQTKTSEKTKANRQEEENQEQKPKEDNTQKPNQNNKK